MAKRKKASTSSEEEESELESDLDSDDSNEATSIRWSSSDDDGGKKAKKATKRAADAPNGVKKEKAGGSGSMPGELNPNYIRKRFAIGT